MDTIILSCCSAPIFFLMGAIVSTWLTDDFYRKMFEVPVDIATIKFIHYIPALIQYEDRVKICTKIREEKEE